jgi:hypothetical protein
MRLDKVLPTMPINSRGYRVKGPVYDIHPEYTLSHIGTDICRHEPGAGDILHEWDVHHTPTDLRVGSIAVMKNSEAKHVSVVKSSVCSPYHKNIGELAYKRLIGHYGSLKSDDAGSVSPEAQRMWQRLGAKMLWRTPSSLRKPNRFREGASMFIKRAEPGFRSCG